MSLASIAQTSGIIARSTNAGSLVWDGRSLMLRLLVTLLLAIGWAGAASAQDSSAAPAKIDGFRSAKFGMDKVEVLTAVRSDFELRKSDVEQGINKAERTDLLSITVDNLLPEGGPARVTYIMGYRSKVLIHVNVAWGKLGGQSPSAESLVTAGNVLQNHFLQRGYPLEGITVNQPLPDGTCQRL